MSDNSRNNFPWGDKKSTVLHLARSQFFNLAIPLLFILFALLWMPVRSNFLFDTDEGQELIKAMLYAHNFTLYDPIWSDQPPLFTVVLNGWFHLWGTSVMAARVLVLGFASLLVWAFFKTVQLSSNSLQAIMGTILLVLSANFLRMSVSAIIGIPSIALAMLSIYALLLYCQQFHRQWLLLSGIAIALSLQFKMFSIFLIPLQGFFLLGNSPANKRAIALLIFLLALVLTFGAIGLTFHSLQFNDILKFHVAGNLKSVFVRENSLLDVGLMYLQDFDLVLLAGLGLFARFRRGQTLPILPLFWLATATLLLVNHKPVWYHHYLLLSVPLAWLASYGVVVAMASKNRLRKVAMGLCIFAAIATPIKLGAIQWQNRVFIAESPDKMAVVRRISTYRDRTHWLFTDNPMYAFRANLLVPPEIAVLSRKRVAAGEMTRDYLAALLAKYQPEQVILERFPEVYAAIQTELESEYFLVEKSGSRQHFVLRDIARGDKPPET